MTAKDLKNALLQEAVQGKLVPQIASEGNAKDLLEEIKKEKAKLIKEGKLKKEKPLPEITEDEIPFDIPENWCWCRLGDFANVVTGSLDANAQDSKGDYAFFTCGVEVFKTKTYAFDCDAILLGGNNASGDYKMHRYKGKFNAYQRVYVISGVKEEILDYFEYIIKYWLPHLKKNSQGTTTRFIKLSQVTGMLVPLPPLAEQKRIVSAIEQFMPLIDEYGKKEAELTALNADIAKALKNAILQEAVQGKLAPQIASEGNAKDLIIPRKNNKQLRPITEDEIPFEIPTNWCWCRLGDLCEIARGGSPRPIKDYITTDPNGYNWIKIGDTEKDGKYINHTAEKIIKEGLKKTRLVHKGDFLLTNSMSFGRPYILNIDGCIHDGWLVISPEKDVFDKDFLYYVLSSSFAYYQFCDSVSGAVVKNLNSDKVRESLFPVPPLSEQKRIVEIIEKMLPLCEKVGENID